MLRKSLGEKVFLFGGHVASQYLISYGLIIEYIESILDNYLKKQGVFNKEIKENIW